MPSIATLTRVNTRYFQSRNAQVHAAAVALHRFQVAIEQARIGDDWQAENNHQSMV